MFKVLKGGTGPGIRDRNVVAPSTLAVRMRGLLRKDNRPRRAHGNARRPDTKVNVEAERGQNVRIGGILVRQTGRG